MVFFQVMKIKILFVKTSALGDIVQTLPILHYLAQRQKHVLIDWVIEKEAEDIIQGRPLIDRTLVIETRKWRKNFFRYGVEILRTIREIRKEKYTVLFDFQGNFKSSLICLFARADHKVGFGKRSVREKWNLLFTNTHIEPFSKGTSLRWNLSLVQTFFQDEAPWEFSAPCTKVRLKARELPVFILSLGSRWKNKQLSYAIALGFVKRLAQMSLLFLVHGNEGEKEQIEQLARECNSGNITVLPRLSLKELQEKMEETDGVISVDSLLLHLAASLGVPTFGIFGPSLGTFYGSEGPLHGHIQGSCPYQEVFERRCKRLRTCPTGACIKDLSLEALWDAFQLWDRFTRKLEA